MELKESSGIVFKKEIEFTSVKPMVLNDSEKNIRIMRAYNEILTLAIMSSARALKFRRKANLFSDYKFYTPREEVAGCNNLIISVPYAEKLAKKDMIKKIKELIFPRSLEPYKPTFPDLAYYPLPAQLALLELAYNGGVSGLIEDNPDHYKLVIDQNWEKLSQSTPIVSRRDSAIYGKRNKQVSEWFSAAAQCKTVQSPANTEDEKERMP